MLAVAGMLVAGCRGDPPAPVGNPDGFFVQRMILHGEQAVEAAALVDGRTKSPAVLTLAKRIQVQPAAEVSQLTEWVSKWGEVPNVTIGSVPGAIKPADLVKLRASTERNFDSDWVDMMIVHHRGAITIAQTELQQGVRAEARALARKVIDTRQPELDLLQGMNGG
jgi:uncharacterized protein (DUF305 family)